MPKANIVFPARGNPYSNEQGAVHPPLSPKRTCFAAYIPPRMHISHL